MPDPIAWDQKFFYGVARRIFRAVVPALRSMGRFPRHRAPMRSLGRIAYSMYVTHFFILCTFSCWFLMRLYGPRSASRLGRRRSGAERAHHLRRRLCL